VLVKIVFNRVNRYFDKQNARSKTILNVLYIE